MRTLLERHRFLLGVAILNLIAGTSVGLAKVTTPLFGLALGANEAQIGMISGSQSLGVLLMGIPLGVLVERHGPGKLFMIGTLCAGTLYALIPSLPAPSALLLCTLCIGFFMPFRFVSLNTVFMEQLVVIGEARRAGFAARTCQGCS